MSDERFHRPELPRREAYHDMANILNLAGTHKDPDGVGSDGAERARNGGSGGFVADGVRAAYDVIDAYIRQGQDIARQVGGASYTPLNLGRDNGELQARWLELTSNLVADWMELLGLYGEAIIGAAEAAPPSGGEQTGDERIAVAFEIASTRPARAEHAFHPGCATSALACAPLSCMNSDAAPIEVGVDSDPAERRVVIKLHIDPVQPEGIYNGVLLDTRSGRAAGTLALTLG